VTGRNRRACYQGRAPAAWHLRCLSGCVQCGIDAAHTKQKLRSFRTRFAKEFPEAVACLERGFSDATAYYAFPEQHWMRIRSTNGLERLHGEIKRRTRAIGAFPDRASALRLITAVALQTTSIWRDRVYLDMSVLDEHYAANA
jgi:putative transposase